jgi:hypothetical protein
MERNIRDMNRIPANLMKDLFVCQVLHCPFPHHFLRFREKNDPAGFKAITIHFSPFTFHYSLWSASQKAIINAIRNQLR